MTWQKIATNSGMFLMAHLEPWSSDVAKIGKNDAREKKTVDLRCLEIDRSWENTYSNDNNRHFGGFCWIFNNSHLGICSFSNNPLRTTCCFSLATTIIPGPRLVTTLFKVEISVFDGQFSGSWNPDQKKKDQLPVTSSPDKLLWLYK